LPLHHRRRGDFVGSVAEQAAQQAGVQFARVKDHRLGAELASHEVEGLRHRFSAEGLYFHRDQ
jgi:hypothetical protein